MSQYCYIPLPRSLDNIRLLRLLPAQGNTAEIRGELFDYQLQPSRKTSHPYEALSYSWSGEVDHGQSILFGNERLDVTSNLHAALLHLRDCSLPRILWIDAICIDQANDEEKAQQIQYMATIYGKASQVVIWLGPRGNGSEEAFEAVRAAGKQSTNPPKKKPVYGDADYQFSATKKSVKSQKETRVEEAVAAVYDRRWFRRVWVLQEVAAARRILIMCGNTEIDGHAFCAGLEQFWDTNKSHSSLRHRIHPLIYLIRQAAYRSRFVSSKLGRASLEICSLGELIDMYLDYDATKRHDKIYAMLGMSTDELDETGLLPDYRAPWNELLQKLVRYLLGRRVHTRVQNDEESAEISGKGCAIGSIDRIEDDSGRQKVSIKFNCTYGQVVNGYHYWHLTLKATANQAQVGDVVCQLQGAPKPMIVRPCDDHWTVIIIMLVPPQRVRIKSFPRDFRLIWDWKSRSGNAQVPVRAVSNHSDRAMRLWDMGLILKDVREDDQAEKKVLEAIKTLPKTPNEVETNLISDEVLEETVQKFGPAVVELLLNQMWNSLNLRKLWPSIVER